jgi:hypothetical protein
MLNSDNHVIKIVERYFNIDYSFVFKNVFDKFIDKFSRDESFDLYIVLRANGSDLEFHIKLKIRR